MVPSHRKSNDKTCEDKISLQLKEDQKVKDFFNQHPEIASESKWNRDSRSKKYRREGRLEGS